MNTIKDRPLTAVVCADGTEALRTITVVPDGETDSTKGRFVMDREAASETMTAFATHGVDIPIDVEHSTLAETPGPDDGAVGWIRSMSYTRGSGLAGAVEWTERGRRLIRSGSFRYLSPVVLIRENDNRVVGIHSAAITTKPAIPGMERLAASQDFKETRAMATGATVATPEQKMGELKALLESKDVKLGEGAKFADILSAAITWIKGKGGTTAKAMTEDALADDTSQGAVMRIVEALAHDPIAVGKPDGPPSEIVVKIAEALGVSSEGNAAAVWARIVAAAKSKVEAKSVASDAGDDAAVANSVRKALNLDAKAGASEVVLAMRVRGADGAASKEVVAMRQAERERKTEVRIMALCEQNVLNPNDTEAMTAARSLYMESPERFEALFANAKPFVEPGRTAAPTNRQMAMSDAQRSYRSDAKLQKACSERAYVRQSLSDAGLAPLSGAEADGFKA